MENNIENLLVDWGVSKRESPDNNLILKNKIINQPFVPKPAAAPKTHFKIAWFPMALSGLALALLILVVVSNNNPVTTSSVNTLFLRKATDAQPSAATRRQTPGPQNEQMVVGDGGRTQSSGIMDQSILTPPSEQDKIQPSYISPPSGAVAINDTREFLKSSYSANVYTSHVQQTTDRIQTTIRGFGGRIDSTSEYSTSGYISFVIPADKFASFKIDLKNLAGEKFITESSQSQNMLSDKQNIEDQQKQTQDTINQLTADRDQLAAKHNQTVASLNAQIKSYNSQIASLQTQIDQHPENYQQLFAQQQALVNSRASLQRQLANENSSYTSQFNYMNSQIQDYQDNLKNLDTQNTNLLNQVATVQGAVYIEHINFWQVMNIYTPFYWPLWIVLIAAFIAYFLFHKKNKIAIP